MNALSDITPRKSFVFNVDVEDDAQVVWLNGAEIGRTSGDETAVIVRWLQEHGADENDDVQVWTHAAEVDGKPAF